MGLVIAGGGGSSSPLLTYKSQDLIVPEYFGVAGTAATIGQATFARIIVYRSVTLDQIQIRVTAGVASATCRLGLYNDAAGRPSTLIAEAASTVDASSAAVKQLAYARTIAAGIYWTCAQNEVAAASYTSISQRPVYGTVNDLSNPQTGGLVYSHTGALAADVSAQAMTLGTPQIVALRIA